MNLGIMQPYFFPYLGYFSLIKATDKWIVFDTPQYKYRSWINRNRVLGPTPDRWVYFTVPLKKHNLNTPINQIEIQNAENWKEKLFGQLCYYRKFAPNYEKVIEFLKEVLKGEFDSISVLDLHTLKAMCTYIGIDFNFEVFSEMKLQIEPVTEAGDWALHICKAMGIQDYINPERGQLFIHKEKYAANNINLKFLKFENPEYKQGINEFIPGLSIIDAMMFNSPSAICQMLDNYQLVK